MLKPPELLFMHMAGPLLALSPTTLLAIGIISNSSISDVFHVRRLPTDSSLALTYFMRLAEEIKQHT